MAKITIDCTPAGLKTDEGKARVQAAQRTLEDTRSDWEGCCKAANRLADLACALYHPNDKHSRKIFPVSTWAEIIAEELGVEIPGKSEDCNCTDCDAIVTADDPYYATPCGTYCSSCMRKHMVDCEICRNEFED